MTWTDLHDACVHQDTEKIIRKVKEHADKAQQVDEHGWTPLHILCWESPDIKTIEALIDVCPQAASDQDVFGNTPLHVACTRPRTDRHLVQRLLQAAPSTASLKNREGLMPLHMACRHLPNNVPVIGMLIEAYPYALRTRIKMGSIVPRKGRQLAKRKPLDHMPMDPSGGMASKSVDLRYSGTVTQVRDGAFPLHMAVQGDTSLEVVEMMIKEAGEILLKTNKFGETPLQLALKHKKADDEVVEVMLKRAPKAIHMHDKNDENNPVHTAAMEGCSGRVAKRLLEASPEAIHTTNSQGLTPLQLAISNGACEDDVIRLFEI